MGTFQGNQNIEVDEFDGYGNYLIILDEEINNDVSGITAYELNSTYVNTSGQGQLIYPSYTITKSGNTYWLKIVGPAVISQCGNHSVTNQISYQLYYAGDIDKDYNKWR
jgi:hypothetical protein